ncbi:MAG: ABC transporter substrate-binding protein [Eubacteriaceae bacterium]|nr:ABC transporter substrate-binding protein [Eubacteriaceae bacterium]
MKKTPKLLLALIMLVALAACSKPSSQQGSQGQEGAFPMTVVDSMGISITFEKEPMNIVSMSPNTTESLFAIGAGDKIVAKSLWCNYPQATDALETVGDSSTANIERIIELGADLVVTSGVFGGDHLAALEQAGIPVYTTLYETVDDIYASILEFGKITGHDSEAQALVEKLEWDLAALQAKLEGVPSKRVFLDVMDLYSSSKKDILGNALGLLKGDNIAYEYEYSSPQLSAEVVVERDPEVYICLFDQDYFVMPAGFESITAFVEGNVYYVGFTDPEADIIARPGPRFVEGLEILAKFIHPELDWD